MLYRYYSKIGWPLVICLTAIPVFLWFFGIPLEGRFETSSMAIGALGRIAGIIAIMLFCINIILSTRLRILETLFGGLNKMFIAHHLTGGIALCIVLVHPLALALRYINTSFYDAALFLLPSTADWPRTLGIIALSIFVTLMIITFYLKLPYHLWLLSHKFLGAVLLLIALHVILITGDNQQIPLLRWYLLAFVIFASISFIYRTLLPRFLVRRYSYIVSNVTSPTNGVVRIHMTPKDEPLDFKSGQFIFVSFQAEGISHEWHPFTISSNSRDEGLSITVKGLGKYTNTLAQIAPSLPNMEVLVEGAYGRFNFRNFHSKHQIWIAGGIGVTPFLSMFKDVSPDYKVDFYYSVKKQDELIDWQQFWIDAQKSNGNLRFIPFIGDRDGLLSGDRIAQISGELTDAEVLLCGPPPMMKALREQLVQGGVKKHKIHSEEFAIS